MLSFRKPGAADETTVYQGRIRQDRIRKSSTMTEPDFDIDFYGDEEEDDQQQSYQDEQPDQSGEKRIDSSHHDGHGEGHHGTDQRIKEEDEQHQHEQYDENVDDPRPKHKAKPKREVDERPVDPGATSALMVSELNWWTTDDDIRGWLQQAGCEPETQDLSFSEHKVNGKSKG